MPVKPKDIMRLVLAGCLAGAAIMTAAAGSGNDTPDPNAPFYRGSLCRHSPAVRQRADPLIVPRRMEGKTDP